VTDHETPAPSTPPTRDPVIAAGLLQLTARLAAASDPSEMLDVMTDECAVLLGVDLVNISLLDADGTTLRLVASRSTPFEVAEEFATYPLDAPLPTRDALADDGGTVVLRSLAERDERYPALKGVEMEHHAFVVTPMITSRVRIGALGLGWHSADDLTDDLVAACEETALICAAALERSLAARAEMRARRSAERAVIRLQMLQSLMTDLAHTTDVHEAGEIIVDRACHSLGAQAATIHVLDADQVWATQIATSGMESPQIRYRTRWPLAESDIGEEVLRTGETVVVRSRRERDERFPSFIRRGITQQAWVALPLKAGGRAVGIAAFGWDAPRDPDVDDLALLEALGSHAAAAIERARLIETEQEQRQNALRGSRRLVLLSEVGRVLDNAHDRDEAFALVRLAMLDDHSDWCRFVGGTVPNDSEQVSPLDDPAALEAAHSAVRTSDIVPFTVLREGAPHADGLAFPVRSALEPTALLVARDISRPYTEADRGTFDEAVRRLSNRLDGLRLLDEQTRIALRLQESLMPAPFPVVPWLDLGSAYAPAELSTDVCGDFFDVFAADDGDVILVIGDVVGRGIEAAGLTGMARHTLRALAGDLAPDRALKRLNTALLTDAASSDKQSLLTAACLRLRPTPEGATVVMGLGGHCQPVVVRDGSARLVGTPGTLLGAFDDVVHPITTLDLRPGDLVVLYTDGVIEAKGDDGGSDDQFGDDRLLDVVARHAGHEPQQVADAVLDTVRSYRLSAPDDMAVLVARIR
jgi:serine phosphatase RsbU (regulator of sigma subunit)/GAF domain-containing protein